jgi:CBS domain-containing protein
MAKAKLALDVMTADPTRCSATTTLDDIAKLMRQFDCGEIPIVDTADRPIGVVTDRDIVCRVVAQGQNPSAHTADQGMTSPVVTVRADASIEDVVSTMERHQIRRVLVVDDDGCCADIIAQADMALATRPVAVGNLVREVSRSVGLASH